MTTIHENALGTSTEVQNNILSLYAANTGFESVMTCAVKWYEAAQSITPLWVCQLPNERNMNRRLRNKRKSAMKKFEYRMNPTKLRDGEVFAKMVIGCDSNGVVSYAVMSLTDKRLNKDLLKAPAIKLLLDEQLLTRLNEWVGEDAFHAKETPRRSAPVRRIDVIRATIIDPALEEVLPSSFRAPMPAKPVHTENRNFGELSGNKTVEHPKKETPTVARRSPKDIKKMLNEAHMTDEEHLPGVSGKWAPLLVGYSSVALEDQHRAVAIEAVMAERDRALLAKVDTATAFRPASYRCVQSYGLGSN